MNTVGIAKNLDTVQTKKVTTTLFDLISSMQDSAANTIDEALIVPTVTEWLRSGRIKFQNDAPAQTAA